MKKLIYPLVAALILLTSATLSIASQKFEVQDGHSIKFDSKDPSGEFKSMTGTVNFDENNLANSSFNLSIDVSSIKTGNGMKDKKALTAEWFDAGKYPKIEFVSTKVVKTDKGYEVHGNLKMKGVSQFRKIPMEAAKSNGGWKFTGTFWVDRIPYKVGKKSDIVPDKLKITYSIPVK